MKSVKIIVSIIILTILLTFSLTACGIIELIESINPLEYFKTEPSPEPTADSPNTTKDTPDTQGIINPPANDNSRDDGIDIRTGGLFPFPFSTVDLFGNTVTEASLGEKELFFVHFWGTWCPPCIAELPELAQLERDFADRVGFLMLLDDFDNKSGAIDLYHSNNFTDTGSSFTVCGRTTFNDNHEIMHMLDIQYVPTTIILDSDGNLLDHLEGAFFSDYAKYLDMHLNALRGEQPTTGETHLSLDKDSYAPGEVVNITITGITQEIVDAGGWIALYHPGAPHTAWDDLRMATYLAKTGTLFLEMEALDVPGEYEFRIFRNDNEDDASFIMGVTFTITG